MIIENTKEREWMLKAIEDLKRAMDQYVLRQRMDTGATPKDVIAQINTYGLLAVKKAKQDSLRHKSPEEKLAGWW